MLDFDKPDKTFHEWGQGCEAVVELIKHFSKPGDTVLDPFLGGAVTVEACMKTKRNVIGYEVDPKYYDLVKERLL
jgi:DNA modification methylase